MKKSNSHLAQLEAESIHIMREVAAQCSKPVMLYSIGNCVVAPCNEGVLALKTTIPATAHRYDLEV
jgi:hypothetical protein